MAVRRSSVAAPALGRGDLDKAKALLRYGRYTLVLHRGDAIVASRTHGLRPLLDLCRPGANYEGFVAADVVVGKAAALLYDSAGIDQVHAQLISHHALEYFRKAGIAASWDNTCPAIMNRQGTGLCPMEALVNGVDNPVDALSMLTKVLPAHSRI